LKAIWNSILKSYYRAETLGSEMARQVFLLPDKCSSLATG